MLQRGGARNGVLFPHEHSGRAAPERPLASVGGPMWVSLPLQESVSGDLDGAVALAL